MENSVSNTKCFEKKMSGFSVIFLHNLITCESCKKAEEPGRETVGQFLSKLDGFRCFYRCVKLENSYSPKSDTNLVTDQKYLFRKPCEPSSVKVHKKKKIKGINSKSHYVLPCKRKYKNVKNAKTSVRKKTLVEGRLKTSPIKKQTCNSDKKVKDSKMPGKGTLKRTRLIYKTLNTTEKNYLDDLYAGISYELYQILLEDESDNVENYSGLKTPVFPFSFSPRERSPSPPTYEDCYSPAELSHSRKCAEEYQYRRKRRNRRVCFSNNREAPQVVLERKENDVEKTLNGVVRALKYMERTNDCEEDPYFSDILDNSSELYP